MSNVAINIAAEFVGKNEFNKANSSVKTLERNVKKLAGVIGVTLSAGALVRFGKNSVKAFLEAEKANNQLANSVKNLGLAFSQADIQGKLDDISAKTGLAGEPLAAAFQSLLTTTGSVNKSFDLLNIGLDVAAGTGRELSSVTQDLSNGYVGVTRGLRKYNLGLTQAQLKTTSFEKIQARLNEQYSGASAAYLDTYAGKMGVLAEAAGNAQERIGGALIDASMLISGSASIEDFIGKIETLTDNVINFIDRFSEGVGIIKAILGSKSWSGMFKAAQDVQVEAYNARLRRTYMDAWKGTDIPKSKQQIAAEKAAELAAKKRAQERLKAEKALTAEQIKRNKLNRANKVFDLDQANLLAALQGNLSEDDKNRAKLQLALLNDNVAVAESLTKKVLMAQDATGGLYEFWKNIPDVKNPFGYLDEWIKQFQKQLDDLRFPKVSGVPPVNANTNLGNNPSHIGMAYIPPGFGFEDAANVSTNTSGFTSSTTITGTSGNNSAFGSDTPWALAVAALNRPIVVQIDGKAITSTTQNESLSGVPAGVNRSNGMFGR